MHITASLGLQGACAGTRRPEMPRKTTTINGLDDSAGAQQRHGQRKQGVGDHVRAVWPPSSWIDGWMEEEEGAPLGGGGGRREGEKKTAKN